MAGSKKNDEDVLDPSDPEMADLLRELSGEEPSEDQDAVLQIDEIAEPDEGLTGTERERGYLEAGVDPTGGIGESVESVESVVERELDSDETGDPDIAAEEGVPWVPPIDPVVAPDERNPEGLEIAAGFGASALDEPYDLDHLSTPVPAEDEMTARVREALRADAMTTSYADDLAIETDGDVVTIRGTVADMDDLEAVLAVAAIVDGVAEVRDELEVATL
jgi:BON domain-containing protein